MIGRMSWSIVVHGGAGNVPGKLEAEHRAGCQRAVEIGASILAAGGSALDAACAAVRVLEDDPCFNSGHGGALDEHGLPALDAAVMRGQDLAYGAVGAVLGVKNPIDLAKEILEDGRHCLLVGPSALEFARRRGVRLVDPSTMITDKTRKEWEARHREALAKIVTPPTAEWTPTQGNTVGCAVKDQQGNLAAATSTGGLLYRYAGRVGDSPIAGAGTYARNDLGAVSATGHGETMLRTVFGFQSLLALRERAGTAPSAILRRELDAARDRVGGTGGVIAILPDGEPVHARNTPAMSCAWQRSGSAIGTDF
jgi:L-asparaginase / beta-aspartyl-peptidase